MEHMRPMCMGLLLILFHVFALSSCSSDDRAGDEMQGINCISDTSPTDSRLIPCRGLVYTVSVPDGCQHGDCGLIVDVHGSTGNAEIHDEGTNLRQLGRDATPPFVVVQPNANGVPPDWSSSDDNRVFAFLQQAVDAWAVDVNRVHFGGSSAGGLMTWRMICRHADVIASFAPISATPISGGRCFGNGALNPTAPILPIHGQFDPVLPFSTVERIRDDIIDAMGDAHQAHVLFSQDGTLWTRHTGNGLQYDLLEYPEGHCLPGGHARFSCQNDVGFEAGQEIIDFYIAHPRP